MLSNASIIIVTYNHKKYLERCLKTIPANSEVIIVDNNSTDGTSKLIEQKFPYIKLIKNPQNGGYAKGVNLGVSYSQKKYVIVVNPDIKFENNAVEELLEPLLETPNIITVPKALLYDGSKINTCGNIQQFTGLAFTKGLGEDVDNFNEPQYMPGLSGVCFAMRRDLYLKIGGFDDSFFLYMEDAELSWKINSKRLKILYVPSSIIYHDYKLNVPAEKIYYLEKGRYMVLRKYLTWKHYLMFLPSLLVTEMFTIGYSMLKGPSGVKFKINAINDGLRTEVEGIDCDRKELINSLDWKIPKDQLSYNMLDKIVRRMGNLVYYVNYTIITGLWNLNLFSKSSEVYEIIDQDVQVLSIQSMKRGK